MATQKELTKSDVVKIMLLETKNQLTKAEVEERLYVRMNIRGVNMEAQIGAKQKLIRFLKQTLANLEELKDDILAEKKESGIIKA
jgi:hypothetical protein